MKEQLCGEIKREFMTIWLLLASTSYFKGKRISPEMLLKMYCAALSNPLYQMDPTVCAGYSILFVLFDMVLL